MANRVTVSEVKEIIDTDVSSTDIEAFITAANLIVTEHLGDSTVLSSDKLKEIERWLTAHILGSTREPQAKSETVAGDVQIAYQGVTGKGLDSTFYGQMVKILDSTGILASQTGKRPATVYAVTSFDTSSLTG